VKFIIKSESSLCSDLSAYFNLKPELFDEFSMDKKSRFDKFPKGMKDKRRSRLYQQMYGGKLVLLEGELAARHLEFVNHYRAVNGSPEFYQELEVPWLSFSETALQGVDPEHFIVGLIHRYDATGNRWYLAAERFTFAGYSGPGDYPVTSTNTLFNINPDGTVGDYYGGLESNCGHLYDPVYFSMAMETNAPLNPSLNVNSVSFAWEELKQLHADNKNNIPGADDSLFTIRFCSISSDYTPDVPAQSLVPFPHCVAMYMCYDGQALINNDDIVIGAIFINKAADFNTVCPPKCDSYSWPSGLVPLDNN